MSKEMNIEDKIKRLKNLIKELKIDKVISFRISADSREVLAEDIETVLRELDNKDKFVYSLNHVLTDLIEAVGFYPYISKENLKLESTE